MYPKMDQSKEKNNSKRLRIGLYIALVSYLTFKWLRHDPSPIINTKQGKLQGYLSSSRSGRPYFEFRGIPYAEPPVGELRFESPKAKKPWNGILDATRYRPSCLHFDFLFSGRYIGEESCLFLNVMTPQIQLATATTPNPKLLPVIVFFHGGAFNAGEAKLHRGRFFMDEDVVLVVPNYRLGIFGFLTTNDDVVKGNMGLKDQIQVLRWVQENIQEFGGDSSQVTIMGESAGGGSVHFLMLSPTTTGLFHRGISLSNAAISDIWQLKRSNSEHVELVANDIGCPNGTSRDFVQCLKSMTAEEIITFHVVYDYPEIFHDYHSFGPSVEHHNDSDYVINDHTVSLLQQGKVPNSVPWMAGVNENEGVLILPRANHFSGFENFLKDEKIWDRYINQILWYNVTEAPEAGRDIREHFFGNLSLEVYDERAIRGIGNMVTERLFWRPMVASVKYHSRLSPTYVYLNNYRPLISLYNLLSWSSPLQWIPELSVAFNIVKQLIKTVIFRIPFPNFGVAHGDEMLLVFDLDDSIYYASTYYDGEMSRLIVKTFADFSNLTKPVEFNGLAWPVVNTSEPLKVMNLDVGPPKISVDPFGKRLEFWDRLNIPWT